MGKNTRAQEDLGLQQTSTRCKANAVIHALDEFLIAPTPSAKMAAVDAMQAYFAEADKVTAVRVRDLH